MASRFVREMAHARRNFIVDHIDGPRRASASDHVTRAPLLAAGILCSCYEDGAPKQAKQTITHTMLTDHGRDVLAQILADYAERLVRAGCLDPSAVPVTIIPFAVETVQTRRIRGAITTSLVVKEAQ